MNQVHARFQVDYPDFSLSVDLHLPGRGVTALFGPSGSGKTTCLRALAGLESTRDTAVSVNGVVWQDDARGLSLPTHQRPVGYVFQDGGLFEHMSVQRNLEYGMRRVPAPERRVSLGQVVDLLGIAPLLGRKPGTLSGGERQRVSIARALAVSPAILLMDEPLAGLDAKRKNEILPYLERLHDDLEIPVIYVSHALDEVARLADHLVLLEEGRVVASGNALDLLTRLDLPLSHGDIAGALVIATVSGHDAEYHLTRVDFSGEGLWLACHPVATGQQVRIRIQARDVSITLEKQTGTSILNILPATVAALSEDGPGQVMVVLQVGDTRLLARLTQKSVTALNLTVGTPVYAQIKGVAVLR